MHFSRLKSYRFQTGNLGVSMNKYNFMNVSFQNKSKLVTYVVASGLTYGCGENIFHYLFKVRNYSVILLSNLQLYGVNLYQCNSLLELMYDGFIFLKGCMAQRPWTSMFWTRNEYHTHNSHQRPSCVSYRILKRKSLIE